MEERKLTASGARPGDALGISVAVSDDVAVVGAFGADCESGFGDCGAAYVFRFDGSNWREEKKLTASDAEAEDSFGRSVSAKGDVALVGTPYGNYAAGSACGAAYVYRFDGSPWA